jgi:TonB family protein
MGTPPPGETQILNFKFQNFKFKILSMQIFAPLLLAFSAAITWAQQAQDPVLRSGLRPVYPAQARSIRLKGSIVVQFEIGPEGYTRNLKTVSGRPPLVQSVLEAMAQWHFEPPEKGFAPGVLYTATVVFSTVDSPLPELQTESLSGQSVQRVDVVAPSQPGVVADACPAAADREPPANGADDDFIELERTACPGNCPVYTVRIGADGAITFKGGSNVKETDDQRDQITVEQARTLIEKARTPEFWSLCGRYSSDLADQPAVIVRARVSAREKQVSNYAAAAPPIMKKMQDAIDAAAQTGRWVGK